MIWAYELLDKADTLENAAMVGANVLLGLVFGMTLTVGFFDYVWMFVPMMSSSISFFARKSVEPFMVL